MSSTLVTCYYKIPSKHDHNLYDNWIANLLENINSNIIIFTSSQLVSYLKQFGKNNSNIVIIEKELKDMPINKKYFNNFWENQENIDKQKKCKRTKYCFQIWNSKFDFLKLAIKLNPFKSDKFIWNDIGSMRDVSFCNKLKNYPKYENISNNKLDLMLLEEYDDINQTFFHNETHVSGSIFGGNKDVILELHKLYYEYFDLYVKHNKFIGCDQQILSTLYLKNKEKINIVITDNNVIDKWFYLYHHYTL